MTGHPRSACVVTVSDRCSAGVAVDRSGPVLVERLRQLPIAVDSPIVVVSDDPGAIRGAIRTATGVHQLVLMTGGTGIGPRDVTPDVLMTLTTRVVPGMGEAMRTAGLATTPHAMLSRQVAAVVGSTLVLALPGSPKAALESLNAVWDVIDHALHLIGGDTDHDHVG